MTDDSISNISATVTRYLNWIFTDLRQGKPAKARDLSVLSTEYRREEEVRLQAGDSEENLKRNRQKIIDHASEISDSAGAQIRKALEP